jgi:hypothetical protein
MQMFQLGLPTGDRIERMLACVEAPDEQASQWQMLRQYRGQGCGRFPNFNVTAYFAPHIEQYVVKAGHKIAVTNHGLPCYLLASDQHI